MMKVLLNFMGPMGYTYNLEISELSYKHIKEHLNALPYVVHYFSVSIADQNDNLLFSGGRNYISGKLEAAKDIIERNDREDRYLIMNIRNMGIDQLVRIPDGAVYVFDDRLDVILGEDYGNA